MLLVVGFNIAVAVIGLIIANSSSQCIGAKSNSQGRIKSFFTVVGIVTITSLIILLLVAMVLFC